MKLVIYNIENSKVDRNGERTCRVNGKTGVISFSRGTAKALGLKAGDHVQLANDEENPKVWFISKTDNEAGFVVTGKSLYFLIRNSFVANILLASLKVEKSASFLVAKEPLTIDGADFYQLITSKPINVDVSKITRKTDK